MLIKVKYWNNREDWVDDLTLNELIASKRIKELYRSSMDEWINVYQLSNRNLYNPTYHRRRSGDQDAAPVEDDKPKHLISKLFRPKKKPNRKEMKAEDWFERGYSEFYSSVDYHEAVRCLAKAIQMKPDFSRAYLIRGMAFEASGNHEQAIIDYDQFVKLVPNESKGYYIRGMAYLRNHEFDEAYSDLETAAAMGHRPALDFLKTGTDSKKKSRKQSPKDPA